MSKVCEYCSGLGKISQHVVDKTNSNKVKGYLINCPHCNGTGKIKGITLESIVKWSLLSIITIGILAKLFTAKNIKEDLLIIALILLGGLIIHILIKFIYRILFEKNRNNE